MAENGQGYDYERLVNVSEFAKIPGEAKFCAEARRLTRRTLERFTHVVDDAELVVSEIFGNGCRHTRSGQGGTLTLSVCGLATGLAMVSIADEGPTLADLRRGRRSVPELQPIPPEADRHRGLHLVDQCATDWGYWNNLDDNGVTVWALFQPLSGFPLVRVY